METLQKQARRLKKIIIMKLCSASRMTFRAWFYRTDPQNIGGRFGKLSGKTFRKHLSKANAPKFISDRKVSGLFFEKRTKVYSLAAPLLG